MSNTHLIFTDAHVAPGDTLTRFDALARLIINRKPDVVINGGDFFDMPSLSSYDVGKSSFEGRRLSKDLQEGWLAQSVLMSRIKISKKRLPLFIALEGNHEHRLTKAVSTKSTLLEGIVDHRSFGWDKIGWQYVPYLGDTPDIISIDGIQYSHFVPTQGTSRAKAGLNLAHHLVTTCMSTTVVGHSHNLDISRKVGIDGVARWGVVAGCFLDKSSPSFKYAGTGVKDWWSGVVILHNVSNGTFSDIELISMETLRDVA
jgi:predicted MPP superfamily phosphohydrolase